MLKHFHLSFKFGQIEFKLIKLNIDEGLATSEFLAFCYSIAINLSDGVEDSVEKLQFTIDVFFEENCLDGLHLILESLQRYFCFNKFISIARELLNDRRQ